jgi:hypothetical protein
MMGWLWHPAAVHPAAAVRVSSRGQGELDYRLIKELWTFAGNHIAVRFAYEYHDDSNHWFRAYGNENWEFVEDGLMRRRIASINEHPSLRRIENITGHWGVAPTTTPASASLESEPCRQTVLRQYCWWPHEPRQTTSATDPKRSSERRFRSERYC